MRGGGCSEGENSKALWDKGKGGGEGIPEGRQTEDAELQVDSALFTSQSSKKQNGPFFFFLVFSFTLILRFIPRIHFLLSGSDLAFVFGHNTL